MDIYEELCQKKKASVKEEHYKAKPAINILQFGFETKESIEKLELGRGGWGSLMPIG